MKQKSINNNIFFEVVLMIIIIPLFSFFTLSMFYRGENVSQKIILSVQKIEIVTEKKFYSVGETIKIFIKNDSNNSIYLEPCEYQNQFERKENGIWYIVEDNSKEEKYDTSGFNRENNITNCDVRISSNEKGLYRSVVQIFYECKKPGESECKQSEVFYSNEFEVLDKRGY